ncbi:MAG: serine hydrolase [Lachnospiraceae bacterium]|nr:serine hydrolase [Lachnospiraceae bacterium]
MDNEKIYKMIALAMSGVAIFFGVLFLIFSVNLRGLNKHVHSLEAMLTEAVKENAQLNAQIKAFTEEQKEDEDKADDQTDGDEEAVKSSLAASDKKAATAGAAREDGDDASDEDDVQSSEEMDGVADLTLLEGQLDDMLAQTRTAAGGRWSVHVKNLNSKIYTERDNSPMRAASLIKLFIMGAVYEQYEELAQVNGKETLDNLLNIMITVSDNDAANQLVTMLGNGDSAAGRQAVNVYCEEHGYANTSMGRMLLEESTTGENYTSVGDCADFLETIYYKEFDYWEEMLEHLQGQQRRNKIPAQIPDGVTIANKTGELTGLEDDVAIVYGDKNPYIICFMTDGLTDSGTAVECIAEMSGKIYGFFNQ